MRIRRMLFVLAGMMAVLFLSGCETGNVAMSVGFSQMGPNGGFYGGSFGTHGGSMSIGRVWR